MNRPQASTYKRLRGSCIAATLLLLVAIMAGPVSGCGRSDEQADTTLIKTVKAPRFNDSTPPAGATYAAQPLNITLNFRVDLSGGDISVSSGGRQWAVGPVKVEDSDTALKRDLKQGMPDGDYDVRYTVKYASGGTGSGEFPFGIDSAMLDDYKDMKGQPEVTIRMTELAFLPAKIIISPGTTVTWVNEEESEHFVNTETHPEHTYFPPMNSRGLGQGATFSVKLETPGQYDYHCSAHYPQGMVGSIVVQR